MKKKYLLLLLLFVAINLAGQQLNVVGTIFENKDAKTITRVPFATVYYYNYEDTTKVEFCALTDLSGRYTLYNMHNGKYIVKVMAQGCQLRRQEIQFKDVIKLSDNNNGRVWVHIKLTRINNVQITPTIFQAKEFMQTKNDTLKQIIDYLKTKVNSSTARKVYRILINGVEIPQKYYDTINSIPFVVMAKETGDKSLTNTYIEYYDLSDENRTLVDGVFNVVFNGKSARPVASADKTTETTDFLIKNN